MSLKGSRLSFLSPDLSLKGPGAADGLSSTPELLLLAPLQVPLLHYPEGAMLDCLTDSPLLHD